MAPQDDPPADLGLRAALKVTGGWVQLAAICGVTRQAAQQWKQIPQKHLLAIQQQTGGKITAQQMRPDVFAALLGTAPAKAKPRAKAKAKAKPRRKARRSR